MEMSRGCRVSKVVLEGDESVDGEVWVSLTVVSGWMGRMVDFGMF